MASEAEMPREATVLIGAVMDEVREVLGAKPSEIFYRRIEGWLEDALMNGAALDETRERIVKTVNLFIGAEEAEAVRGRLAKALDGYTRGG